jgi:hypothetical protein
MKKLSVLLVAMAVAVSASAGIKTTQAMRSVQNNKIMNTEMKLKMSELKGQAISTKLGVINEQPAGELKSYNRAGQGVYASNGYLYCGQQDGTRMDIVWGEDGKVYLKDILFNFGAGTWVEGEIFDGNYIRVPLDQSMYWSDQYQADINLCWGTTYLTEDGKIGFQRNMDVTEVMYFIDETAGTITLLDSEGPTELDSADPNSYVGTGLAAYWTDDDSWYGNIEWNTVLTEREPVIAPTVITEQPEGELYTYKRTGWCIYSSLFGVGMSEQDGKIKVVFDGQGKAYIQNPMWWHDGNNTWVEGTYDWMTGIITVPTGQFLNWYDSYEYGIQMMWGITYTYPSEDDPESYMLGNELDDRTTEVEFMIDDDMIYLLNSEGNAEAEFPENYNAEGLYSIWSDDQTWGGALEFNTQGKMVNVVPAVPANPTADEWYDCGDESGYSKFYFTLPTEDVDGNPIDPEYLSYSIYTDNDEVFVFDEATYYYDTEGMGDLTEIPYWIYSSGYDFHDYLVYFYRTNEGVNGEEPMFEHRIGIQVHYTVNGIKNSSDIVYLEVFPDTKVNEVNAGKTVANVRYFNVAGQEMAQPAGMTIQVTTYTDGTTSAVKVVK